MTWCKNNFRLEIYNKQIGEFVKSPRNVFRDVTDDGEGVVELIRCYPIYQKQLFGRELEQAEIIPFCIKKGWINAEWQKCADWVLRNYLGNEDAFLWRGIRPDYYDELMDFGHTTALLTEEYENKKFKEANLPRSDYIWATDIIEKAWEQAAFNNPSLIVVYRKEFFKPFGENYYVWIKKDKNVDWKDTVEAIFRVYFLYKPPSVLFR